MTIAETPESSEGQRNRFPLSANLELFCIFDKGDDEGAFGPRHLVNLAWRVTGEIDVAVLQAALDDVVVRNEILRTEVIRGDGDDYQRVLPPSRVDVQVIDLSGDDDPRSRDERADSFINKVEYFELRAADLPHIRAVLGRFDERDAVLVLLTHHTASDGYSMSVLIREIAALYAQHKGFGPADLPEPVQYKEFSAWQQEELAAENAERARAYWRRKLDGAQTSMVATDQPDVPYRYAVHRQIFPPELATAAGNLAKALRASPFMVLLAAFNVLWHKKTGDVDVVTPILSSGRGDPRFAEAVGPFFNLVPLRTDLSDNPAFSELVNRTRTTCLEAYAHDLPYAHIAAEAPDLNKPYEAGNLSACAFQSFQFPDLMEETTVGDLTYTEVRKRVESSSETSEIPNGIVFTLDLLPTGEIAAHARYSKADFLEPTIEKLVGDYREILALATTNPTIRLRDL
ncbi:condensation domain-containing protein [Actinophytocola sp. NPDC049390]|uniref:condensation domain-containing protein n=1 Tax=Actinophytocola sp. NPDC049390 TaxID=3363894 RepID=UPI00378E4EEF